MKRMLMAGITVALLAMGAGPVQAMIEMTDYQLDQVTAGTSVNAQRTDQGVSLAFNNANPAISGTGDIKVKNLGPIAGSNGQVILNNSTLTNNALVNVVAVSSNVKVITNLVININSTVGAIQQLNTSGSTRGIGGVGNF